MGKALELLTGFVTAPGTTLTGLTMAAGNSLTIRSSPIASDIRLIQAWNDNQTLGVLRIRSPRMHDNVEGIRLIAAAAQVEPLLPWELQEKVISQDTLITQLSGSGTGGDIETASLLIHYDDLPGIDAVLISPADVATRMVHLMATENTIAAGTGGGYTGQEALNAEFDQFKANTPYALLGYTVSAECASVRYQGSDFGSIGLGGPGNPTKKWLTSRWFVHISEKTGLPLVPVFQSENVNNVLLDVAQDENGTDVIVNTICAELTP